MSIYVCLILISYAKVHIFTENLSTTLTNNLRDDYIKNKCNLDLEEWPPNQPKSVVNVALIHYKGSRTEQELIEISKRHKEGTPAVDKLAHLSRVTKDISIIFQTDYTNNAETKTLKLILIEGAPGIGKTVLARRIAYLWAKKELLANLNILFLLFLRDPVLQSIKTTEELIQYLSRNNLDKEEIKNCVQQIKELQVGIVIDGYDEYPIQLRKKSFIVNLINGYVFHNCTIVLTSRPTATLNLHSRADRRVEILGFAQEERDAYICESLDSPDQRKQVQDYLKCQPIINGLVYVPLHLAVLLYLFKNQSKLPETLTEMNKLFILHTIYRSLSKDDIITEDEVTAINCIEDLPDNISGIIKGLSKLAFTGLQNDQLVFTWGVITENCPQINKDIHNIPGVFNGFGLLQAVQHYPKTGLPGTTVSFNFLHFTMQEFLAALHVSDVSITPYEQQLSLLETTFWKSTFNFMWMMYVGINGLNSKTFMEFLYKATPETDIKQLKLSNDIKSDKRKCLHLFQCFMEAKSAEIPKEISSIFCNNEISFHGLQLLPHHISSLTLYLSKYSMQLEALNLRDCHIGDVGMSILEHYFTTNPSKALTIKHIDLFGNNSLLLRNVYCAVFSQQNHIKLNWSSLGKVNIEEIIGVINSNMAVQSLNLSDNDFNDDDAERIAGALINNNTLKELDFSRNKITTKGAIAISDCVQKNVQLQNLKISWNNHFLNTDQSIINFSDRVVTDTDTQIVTKILCKNETVTKLDLSHNRITDKGAKSICMCIASNNSLKELDISGNRITVTGLRKILDSIQTNQTVQKLSMSHYFNISETGVVAVSEYLNKNNTLQELNFSHNRISTGIVRICKALQVNKAIRILDISHNNIADEEAIAICECLEDNNTLQKLDISYNKLSDSIVINIGKALQKNGMLQALVIANNNITDEGAVAISECLKDNNSLQELDISHNQVSDNGVANISKALQVNTTLQTLLISHNNITDDGVVAIGKTLQSHYKDYSFVTTNKEVINEDYIKNSALQKLNMSHNSISSKGVVALCDYLKNNITLKKLTISWNDCKTPVVLDSTNRFCNISNLHFGNVGATLLSVFLFKKDEIQKLDISRNAISDDGAAAISEYLNNNTLQQLDMSHNQVSCIGIIKITKALLTNKTLQVLDISHNKISDDGAIAIGETLVNTENPILQKLDLSYNNISINGIGAFSYCLKHNNTLQELKISLRSYNNLLVLDINNANNFSGMHFGDTGTTLISAFLFQRDRIQILDLSINAISDDGAVAISEYLKHNGMLQELNISHNEITKEGIVEILKSINSNCPLHALNLTHNIVTKSGLMMIYDIYKKCSNMPSVQISYNEIVDNTFDTTSVSFEYDSKKKFDELTAIKLKFDIHSRRVSYKLKVLCYCAMQDNFVKKLNISRHDITNEGAKIIAKALHGNRSLQKLDISNNNIYNDGAVAIIKCLANNNTIQELDISSNNILSENITDLADSLKNNSTLKKLTISWNDGTRVFAYVFDGTTTFCNMSKKCLTNNGTLLLSSFLFQNNVTEKLDISHNNISDDGTVAISEFLKNNNTLQQLDVSHNQVSSFGVINISKALLTNITLQILDISYNNLCDEGAAAISECLMKNDTLRHLDISHNQLSNIGIINISKALQINSTLQVLVISHNNISDDGAVAISEYLNNNTLQHLDMSHNLVSGIGAIHISKALQINSALQVLVISHNNISDDGAVAISEYLKYNGMLQELNMSHNEITSEGIVEILKSINSDSPLHTLDLTHNTVTKSGLIMIYNIYEKCNNMPSIQISYTEIVDKSPTINTFLVSFKNNHNKSFDQLKTTKVNFNGSASYRAQVLCFCATENESIKELDISRHDITNKVADIIAKALQGNVSLQNLYISSNNISDDGAIAISECLKVNTTLKKLDISNNKITNDGIIKIAEAIKANTTLSLLDVSENIMDRSTEVARALSDHLKHNNTLQVLKISWNYHYLYSSTTYVYHVGMNNKCYVDIVRMKSYWDTPYTFASRDGYHCKRVEFNDIEAILLTALVYGSVDVNTIRIVNKEVSDSAALVISDFLKENKTIETLKLSKNTISTEAISQILKAIQTNTTLQILNISSNNISDDVAVAISKYLKNNNTLQQLDMSCNQVSGIEVNNITKALPKNITLQILDISHNDISDDGAVAISEYLNNNNSLQQLDMSHNHVSNFGIINISKALLTNITLQILNISYNNLWDEGAAAISECLMKNDTLKQLNISNNKITNDGIIKIAAAIAANTTLSLLNALNNNMHRSTEVARALSDHLKHNNTLQVLKISWYGSDTTYVYHVGMNNECYVAGRDTLYYSDKLEFNDIEAIVLTALVYGSVDINTVRIVNKEVSDSAALVISDFFKENKTIESLKLSENTISTEAFNQIIKAIQTNTTLQIVDISFNKISDDVAVAISECLTKNNTLQELNLSCNSITTKGITKIAEAIAVNTGLHTLDLSFQYIADESITVTHLRSSLRESLRIDNDYLESVRIDNDYLESVRIDNDYLESVRIDNDYLVKFIMILLNAMEHNYTMMRLVLPTAVNKNDAVIKRKLDQINKERTKRGIKTLQLQITAAN